MGQGIRDDQLPLFKKDMYIASREGYKEEPTVFNRIFKVISSAFGAGTKAYQILGAHRLTRHTVEGQAIDFKAPVNGWTYYCKYWTYSAGLIFSYEAVQDTVKLGNLLKDLARTWGRQNRYAKEEHAARVFNKGGALSGDWVFNGTYTGESDGSGDLLYDSYPMFNLSGNARSSKNGGTYYNSVASIDIDPDNFETLYILHTETNAYDERDQIVTNPVDTLLTGSVSKLFKAQRLFNTQKLPYGQLNDENPYAGLIKNIIHWRFLNDTGNPWYIGKAQSDDLQFHEREKAKLRFFRDENNAGYKASNMLRIGTMIKNFRTWTRGGGSSS